MTTQTLTLAEFILQRIAEDEAVARAAEHADGPETLTWQYAGRRHLSFNNGRGEDYIAVACGNWDRILVARDGARDGPVVSAHIARHDPARVLAECEAKRRIVEDYLAVTDPNGEPEKQAKFFAGVEAALRDTMQYLALPYADHADYRDEFRP